MDDSVKRIRIMKIWEILNTETDEEHPIKTEALLLKLDDLGVGCHRKTLYEDIKLLNAWGYEVMVNRAISNEYYVVERKFDLPEIQILMDAVQAARFISPKKTEQFVNKIASLAGSNRANALRKNVVNFTVSKSTNEQIYYIVNEITQAIEDGKKISFLYFKLDTKGNKVYQRNKTRYVVNPIATVFSDDKYYLMCYDDKHGNLSHYRVDRMDRVNMLKDDITPSLKIDETDIQKHKKQLFGMYAGDPREISFVGDKSIVDSLIDKFGSGLNVEERDGKLYFTVTAQISPTFISWIIGFGDKLKVLAPSDIVAKVKEHLKVTLAQYV